MSFEICCKPAIPSLFSTILMTSTTRESSGRMSKEFNGEAEVIEADIRDASAMKEVVGRGGYDSIIHIAARAGVRSIGAKPFLLH